VSALIAAALLAFKLAGVSVLLWEIVARAGAGPLSLLPCVPARPPERFGIALLVGWSLLGLTLLGLAATGLFWRLAILVAPVALCLLSRPARSRRILLVDALASMAPLGRAGAAAAALAVLLVLPRLLVPPFGIDAWWYELGAPWQYLGVHRLILSHVPNPFHLPAPANLDFSVALALGDDRLVPWIAASCFLAAWLVFAGLSGGGVAVWAGLLLALSTQSVAFLLYAGKSDLPAAAMIVAGALVHRSGFLGTGLLLFGFGLAAKPVAGPLVVVWLLFHPPARGTRARALALLAVPSLAWWAKTWAATGNPVYPLLWRIFPSLGWDARNAMANAFYQGPLGLAETMQLSTFPFGLLRYLTGEQFLLAISLPAVLAVSLSRRAAWAGLLGAIAILATGHIPRFAAAATWLLGFLAALEIARLPHAWRRAALAAVALAAVLRLVADPLIPRVSLGEIAAPVPDQRAARMTAYADLVSDPELALSRRLIVVGELKTYLLPGRVIATGGIGETPLVWRIVRESWTLDEVRRRFRQLGADRLVHNFVTGDYWTDLGGPFPWADWQLALYRAFVRRHLRVASVPRRVDHVHGGFYVYRVGAEEGPGPRILYYLPGAEGMLARAGFLQRRGEGDAASREVARLGHLLPDVGHVRNVMAYSFRNAGRWQAAYRMYGPAIEAGMVDDENWAGFALAAERLGKTDEAAVAARRAWELYPHRRREVDQLLATLEHGAGERALERGAVAEAREAYLACLASLGRLPASKDLRGATVFAVVRLSYAYALEGKYAEARDRMNEAIRLDPAVTSTQEARQVLRLIGGKP